MVTWRRKAIDDQKFYVQEIQNVQETRFELQTKYNKMNLNEKLLAIDGSKKDEEK